MSAGDGDAPEGEPSVRRRVTILNNRGLHARAAAKFATAAAGFEAKIWVTKGDLTVSGLSIMGLMMLAAAPGQNVELVANGPDAEAAIDALSTLIANKFEEDENGA